MGVYKGASLVLKRRLKLTPRSCGVSYKYLYWRRVTTNAENFPTVQVT